MPSFRPGRLRLAVLVLALIFAGPFFGQSAKKPLTFSDVMKFNALTDPTISADGLWVAYTLQPDRGDGEVQVRSTDGEKSYSLKRGSPRF